MAAAGCTADPDVVTIDVTTGQESDTFQKDPAITSIEISALDAAGDTVASATSTPGGSFSFGELPLEQFLSLSLVGRDAQGAVRVRGRSPGLVVGQLTSSELPLFAARTNEWSRPPDGLGHSRMGAVAASVAERFLLLAGGEPAGDSEISAASPAYYDWLALARADGGTLARAPASVTVDSTGFVALLVADDGASLVDYDGGASVDLATPAGLEFSDVAGGESVGRADGASYVVGPTRPESATDRSLLLLPNQTLVAVEHAVPRRAAAATWTDGAGLVVAGGSVDGPGVEVLADNSTLASTRAYPPDPVTGAAAIGTSGRVVLIGGLDLAGDRALSRALDPSCVSNCEHEVLDIDLGARLDTCRGFLLAAERALVVGADADDDGTLRAFTIDFVSQSHEEVPLREPRRGAVLSPTPLGTLALLGGELEDGSPALSIEVFTPP